MKKVAFGVTTIYNYDVARNLISESEADGTPLRDIVYLNGERIAMRLYGSQAGWYYFVNDHLGTPRKVVDASGNVVWQAAYLPFGKAQVLQGSTIVNNFRFPGQYYDAETELHYNWHRYYMPAKGRYLTPDPIGLEGGINLYAYVIENPVNWVDPDGLNPYKDYSKKGGPSDASHPKINEAKEILKEGGQNARENARKIIKDAMNKASKEMKNACGKLRKKYLKEFLALRAFLKTGFRLPPFIIIIIDPNTGMPIGMDSYTGTTNNPPDA